MKELSIEDKAKRYDEAIEKAKDYYHLGDDKYKMAIDAKAVMEYIFPELKESEDELTWLKRFIQEEIDCLSFDIRDSEDRVKLKNLQRSIAWLERQCEKETKGNEREIPNSEQETVVIIPKFRVGDVIRLKGSTAEYTIESISGECYHGKGWGLHIGCEEDYELVEQKSAWSEEDEMIKETLKLIVKCAYDKYGIQGKEIGEEKLLAWLEKQDKKKSIDDLTQQEAMDIAVAKCFEWDKQKPADNVEPKFEIGDLITNGILVGKIDEIHELGYHAYFGDHYADVLDVENWHTWTIQDAKDGDILCCESGWTCIFKTLVNDETFSSYCFMDKTKWFCETGSECHTLKEEYIKAYNGKIYPATKEQRDLLFQKMKEAGYEWDAEKKELKKIEQEPQYTWKPSEQDILLLERIAKSDPQNFQAPLDALIVQLKKLREE